MQKKELLTGLEKVRDGIDKIINAINDTDETVVENNSMPKPVEVSESVTSNDEVDEELLNMRYAQLKKMAAELGVSATGKRDELIERIQNARGENAGDSSVEDETPKKNVVSMEKKRQEVDDLEEQYGEQADAILEENSIEDILDELKGLGKKATKKNARKLLMEALADGSLELEEEDDEEEVEDEETEDEVDDSEDDSDDSDDDEDEDDSDDETADITPDTYFAEYDEEGINDPDSMSDSRKKGVHKLMEKLISEISEEETSVDDMKEYLEEALTEEELNDISDYEDDDIVALYLECRKKMIDEEGEEAGMQEPYEIGDTNFCCGHELIYNKKSKEYKCPVCGQIYEE